MSNNKRNNNQTSDQYALSLLVNAAEGRDAPRQRSAADSRFADQAFNLRNLAGASGLGGSGGFSGVDASLEEQLLLQQQAYGSGGSGAILSQLREQNLLSQLNQQQQLAALLGLGSSNGGGGGGGGWNPSSQELRQALASAQFRQNQAASQLTQADFLALSRAGAFPSSLLGGGDGGGLGGYGGSVGGAGAYGTASRNGVNPTDFAGSQAAFAAELESLQRLEELNHRKRLLAATSTEAPRPTVDRGVSAGAKSMMRETQQVDPAVARTETTRPLKVESKGKDDLSKIPGSVIVPCRARGMPMDHNFKTAYFVIPENVKHGEELICSYFACRNAGIKFRYCSHCKVPVAKRNFRKRHKHGGEIIGDKGDDSGDDDETPKKGIPSQITATSRDEEEDEDGISSQSADSSNHGVETKKIAVFKDSMVNEVNIVEEKNVEKAMEPMTAEVGIVSTVDTKITDDRQLRWMSLLSKRPSTKESDTMSAWLMEVLAVSDLETPLPAVSKLDETIIKEKQEMENAKKLDDLDEDIATNEKNIGKDVEHDEVGNEGKPADEVIGRNLIKKKRPVELLESVEDERNVHDAEKVEENGINGGRDGTHVESTASNTSSYVTGSFAEWKERKKQKMQSKGIVKD